ncbi:hypothetical protein OAN24_05100, partial [Pseudodesulfovibrio sp.]|nr:hypothetical protein [Pseudodesulfovibrio sp.]
MAATRLISPSDNPLTVSVSERFAGRILRDTVIPILSYAVERISKETALTSSLGEDSRREPSAQTEAGRKSKNARSIHAFGIIT